MSLFNRSLQTFPTTARFDCYCFAPALLSSQRVIDNNMRRGLNDHNVHCIRDQCGVTYKRRLELCALDHAAGRPLTTHSITPPLREALPPAVASRLHTCCASCSQFGDRPAYYRCACVLDLSPRTLLQGCKRLSGVSFSQLPCLHGEPFSQRCLCTLYRWSYRLGPAYRPSNRSRFLFPD
jgi:hypothetical protein